jgi:hypothetical protein
LLGFGEDKKHKEKELKKKE